MSNPEQTVEDFPQVSQLFIKQYKVSAGDFILVKRPKGVKEEDFHRMLLQLSGDAGRFLNINIIVIGVDSFSEIKHLDQGDMEKLGWVRRESVLAFKDEKLFPGEIEEEE